MPHKFNAARRHKFDQASFGMIHATTLSTDTFRMLQPGQALLRIFAGIAEPLLDRTVANTPKGRTLAQLRQTLFPKLIGGEISLSNAEEAVEAAA